MTLEEIKKRHKAPKEWGNIEAIAACKDIGYLIEMVEERDTVILAKQGLIINFLQSEDEITRSIGLRLENSPNTTKDKELIKDLFKSEDTILRSITLRAGKVSNAAENKGNHFYQK